MRTTVGPLSPAVYWRRRALVLGAVLLGLIVLFVSCSGSDDDKPKRGQSASSATPLPPPSGTPQTEPSWADADPNGEPSRPAPDEVEPDQPSLGDGGASGNPPPPGQDSNVNASTICGDNEMSVTPVPASATIKRGSAVVMRLKIKNIGTRTCNRDVGADPQEIYIDQGARKYWSSDTCSTIRNSSVRSFPPNLEMEFSVTWNGRQSSKCGGGLAAGPVPIAGQYEIRGRLGTKVSNPVTLTIVN